MHKLRLIALVSLATMAIPTFAGELISNGDFSNPSFDASYWNTSNPDGPYIYGSSFPIPSWSSSGSSGVWLPSSTMLNPLGPGDQAGWTSDGVFAGSLTQDTGHILAAGESLTFSFAVGDRSDLLSVYGITTEGVAYLMAGSSTIVTATTFGPGTSGVWTPESFSFSASSLTSFIGQDLSVELYSPSGTQASWKNVSLQVVPEPASYASLGIGLGVLGLLRRKRR